MVNLRNALLSLLVFFITVSAYAVEEKEIVFAITPMVSPVLTISSYRDFFRYISDKAGKKIILKQREKYSEVNSLLKTGDAQFALMCTGAYLSGRYEFRLEILAVPVINGKTTYNSYIIVSRESKIDDFHELRAKVFAFADPLSLPGRLYPVYLLNTMGFDAEKFFRKTFYTLSYKKSIESVAYGFADGAAVDSFIYDKMKRIKDPVMNKVKIIKISPPYGIPPIVSSPRTNKFIKQLMLTILLKMARDKEGERILKKLQIEKFVLPNPAIYQSAVKMRQKALLQ